MEGTTMHARTWRCMDAPTCKSWAVHSRPKLPHKSVSELSYVRLYVHTCMHVDIRACMCVCVCVCAREYVCIHVGRACPHAGPVCQAHLLDVLRLLRVDHWTARRQDCSHRRHQMAYICHEHKLKMVTDFKGPGVLDILLLGMVTGVGIEGSRLGMIRSNMFLELRSSVWHGLLTELRSACQQCGWRAQAAAPPPPDKQAPQKMIPVVTLLPAVQPLLLTRPSTP